MVIAKLQSRRFGTLVDLCRKMQRFGIVLGQRSWTNLIT